MPSVATRRWDTNAPSTLKRNTPGRWPIEQPHTCPPQGVHSTDMDASGPPLPLQTNYQSSAVILIVHCHWPMLQCNKRVMILSRSAQPMPFGDSYEEPLRLLPWQVRSGAASSRVQELLFADMR